MIDSASADQFIRSGVHLAGSRRRRCLQLRGPLRRCFFPPRQPPRRALRAQSRAGAWGSGRLRMIIAIDGPAASGKGTIARRIAAHYGLPHLDTGLLYRATAAALIAEDRNLYDEAAAVAAARGLGLTDFDDATLRTRQMGGSGVGGRGDARRPRGAARGAARICRPAGRRGPRRPGHRHSRLSASGREDLRHRQRGDPGAAARARIDPERRKGRLWRDSGRHHPPRRPRFRPRRRAVAPGRTTRSNSTRPISG